jgi:molybdopterin-guanine dinucleotide biosynthesis protein A
MGRDKGLLVFGKNTLAEFVAGEVARAAGSVTLVGDSAIYGELGLPVLPDAQPGLGPLGGISSALRHTAAEWNLIVACDMPRVSTALFAELLDAAETSPEIAAVVPVGPTGQPEPLCAVWNRRALPAVDAALAAGQRQVIAVLEGLSYRPWPVARVEHFTNLNTPEEWAPYAAD